MMTDEEGNRTTLTPYQWEQYQQLLHERDVPTNPDDRSPLQQLKARTAQIDIWTLWYPPSESGKTAGPPGPGVVSGGGYKQPRVMRDDVRVLIAGLFGGIYSKLSSEEKGMFHHSLGPKNQDIVMEAVRLFYAERGSFRAGSLLAGINMAYKRLRMEQQT